MDKKVTKHTLKTEQPVYSETAEILLESSITATNKESPEKILKCCHKAAITSKSVSNNNVFVDGTVSLCVIFLAEGGLIKSVEQVIPFSKTFESEKDLSAAELMAEITSERFSATLQDNTITIKGNITLSVLATNYSKQEIICDIDIRSIEQLGSIAGVTIPVGKCEKNLVVEEEISVGNGQPSVENIIRYTAGAVVDEYKIIGGKVMVKGTVKVYVLYQPSEGTRPQNFEESFPFSQLIDIEGLNENCKCSSKVTVLFCDVSPRVNSNDEIRTFSATVKLNITVKAYCETEIPIILDAYSTSGGYKVEQGNVSFKQIKENLNERFVTKKTLEFTDGAIGSVIDLWCEIKNTTVKFENQSIKLNGTLNANLLAFDCEGTPVCFERPLDFEYTYILKEPLSLPELEFALSVVHCTYTITSASTVLISVELKLEAALYHTKNQEILVNIEEDQAEECKAISGSIVLYFAETGEKIWDIARRYNSSVKEIKELNGITEDCLLENRKFIIPTK